MVSRWYVYGDDVHVVLGLSNDNSDKELESNNEWELLLLSSVQHSVTLQEQLVDTNSRFEGATPLVFDCDNGVTTTMAVSLSS